MTAIAPTGTTTWTIDPSHSSVEFSARHMMFTTVKGRFADVRGVVTTDGESPAAASVAVTMKTESVDTRSEQRDAHLRSADFLDAAQYPEVAFTSTSIVGTKDTFTMTGDLTIRGVTRPVALEVRFEGTGNDPWGNERMGFSARGKIDRRDFGLTWNQALEAGGVLVSNEIKIDIDAQIIKTA